MKLIFSAFTGKAIRRPAFILGLAAVSCLLPGNATAQIAPGYEVATWQGFKAAAVSYTFDDNTSKQLTVAVPLFDQYQFKTTLFTVTNWGPNWAALRAAAQNGHEIASHTVSHSSLNTLNVSNQDTELRQSQATIKSNIAGAQVLTVAYPNCNIGDVPTIQKYYIAGRVCSGQIVPRTPSNFYQISSLIAGSQGAVKTAADFNAQVNSAKNSNGWAVFLMHGIDNDGGYSPLASAVLADHLAYVNTHRADYWVATFANVVKYIKQRNAVAISESTITADSLQVTLQDNLDDQVYNMPVTVRRQLPNGWQGASVYVNRQLVASAVSTVNNTQYITFEAVPTGGEVHIANKKAVVAGVRSLKDIPGLSFSPNPFSGSLHLTAPGAFQYSLFSLSGQLLENGEATDSATVGAKLAAGTYLLKVQHKKTTGIGRVVKVD
ncbi:polysaccharide deacetylase family protein [Rufibacter roseus]|uniref:Polysaccharide deacetylase family protein n=1 Tax=Rufibacter roseus TaxID=1567108 RepID=A0ABW2DHW5_9BACT|nr:polysaccharide deacetylase family protein [Rufibacter roseus]